MWNNSSFPADIDSAVSISLPDSVVILTTISSVLSVVGAITIFLSYLVVSEARNSTRLLLVHVTVADLITCVGTFVGSIRYFLRNEDDYIVKEKTLAINCTGTDNVCLVQSFVNTFSAMASFFWTAIIMLHILMTLHKMEDWTNRWKIVAFNILSWGIPLAITIAAAAEGALGEDFSISTGPWCWIKGCLSPTTVIMWMSVTGKFWEVLTYLVSMLFYLGSKYLIWRRTRTQTYSFGENSNYNLRDEDQLYTMIFLVLVPLRIFGTIRFFIAVHKSMSNDNLVIFNHIDHVLLYFQSVGDSGQAFCNAILFCLKDRVIRRGLLERLRRFCGRPTYGESERLLSNNYVS